MKASQRYFCRVNDILAEVFRDEADAIEEAAQAIAGANRSGNSVGSAADADTRNETG